MENSFASNGECGLKRMDGTCGTSGADLNSFASNGECGLKLAVLSLHFTIKGEFIRQQWRMWIETIPTTDSLGGTRTIHSPAMANVD